MFSKKVAPNLRDGAVSYVPNSGGLFQSAGIIEQSYSQLVSDLWNRAKAVAVVSCCGNPGRKQHYSSGAVKQQSRPSLWNVSAWIDYLSKNCMLVHSNFYFSPLVHLSVVLVCHEQRVFHLEMIWRVSWTFFSLHICNFFFLSLSTFLCSLSPVAG